MTLNRDFLTAVCFLLLTVGLYVATYSLPEPMFGQLASWTWPRVILIPLGLLSVVLLIQSQKSDQPAVSVSGLTAWMRENVNPFICFALFFAFLITMPTLGMLLGGLIYVFLTLCVLGGWQPKQLMIHAAVSVVFVTSMWGVFSFLLGVVLPEGTLLRVY